MRVHRFCPPQNDKGTVFFGWKFKLKKESGFELGTPDSTQSTSKGVSEYPESGRVQHDQADGSLVTINRNKGKLFTVLGQRTKRHSLLRASRAGSNRK
jgi:hypothetical protein